MGERARAFVLGSRTPPGVRELKLYRSDLGGQAKGVAPLPGCVN